LPEGWLVVDVEVVDVVAEEVVAVLEGVLVVALCAVSDELLDEAEVDVEGVGAGVVLRSETTLTVEPPQPASRNSGASSQAAAARRRKWERFVAGTRAAV
jgi:hypothetical protein